MRIAHDGKRARRDRMIRAAHDPDDALAGSRGKEELRRVRSQAHDAPGGRGQRDLGPRVVAHPHLGERGQRSQREEQGEHAPHSCHRRPT